MKAQDREKRALSAVAKKPSSHTQPKSPTLDLKQPGRLRVCHLLALLSVSHSTLYAGFKTGRYPTPDGHDGQLPYWKTETMRQFLQA